MLLEKKLNIESSNIPSVIETFSSIEKQSVETVKLENISIENTSIVPKEENKKLPEKLSDDFHTTNKTLKECIEINLTALRLVAQSLNNTPYEARIGEVLARLLESMTDLNQQYMNSYRQFTEIFKSMENIQNEKNENGKNPINIQNAAIFTGTLKDLIDSIPEKPI